ncbi:MAG: hypothetical protein CVU42_17810 [Chloroflexi bacterium HGW-Chloroflexi-4]|jgi:hypothetical protein|nr:MAG: hypothetical protein CVU42_17810 [Chloroflexi bacterium HGW-Chloroflexi-4]
MDESKRGTMAAGIILVALGAVFFALNLIPGIVAAKTWPLVLVVIGIGFCLPVLIWPKQKESLAGLLIPGSILLVLGAIFLFNTFTGIWSVWAIAWMLIPGSVGLGLILGAWAGKWDKSVTKVGLWMLVLSLAVFALFASLFGNVVVKSIGAGLLVVTGLVLLVRSLMRKQAE